jgi:hypothetical protein
MNTQRTLERAPEFFSATSGVSPTGSSLQVSGAPVLAGQDFSRSRSQPRTAADAYEQLRIPTHNSSLLLTPT